MYKPPKLEKDLKKAILKEEEIGYIYTYPPKRAWRALKQPQKFVVESWKGFEDKLGIYVHVPYCPVREVPESLQPKLKQGQFRHGTEKKMWFL